MQDTGGSFATTRLTAAYDDVDQVSGRYSYAGRTTLPPQTVIDDGHADDEDDHPVMQRLRRFVIGSRVLLVLSILAIIGFAVGLGIEPMIVRDYVKKYTALVNSHSAIYDAWQDPMNAGVPVHRRYFFYNVTNPHAIMRGVAPILVEIGPFTYAEETQKYDVRWFLNGSVGYKYKRLMRFVPEESIDALTGRQLDDKTDIITTSNPALKGILYRVGKLPPALGLQYDACTYLDLLVNNTVVGPMGYFSQHTPHEFLWGYVDKLWESVHWLLPTLGYDASTVFQAQWNGTAPAPSAYTFRAGQKCPLWQNQSICNSSGTGLTMEMSGRSEGVVIPPSQALVPPSGTWLPLNAGVEWPPAAPKPDPLTPFDLREADHGTITSWAGQRSAWWWGPLLDGMTGGMELTPRTWWHSGDSAEDFTIPDVELQRSFATAGMMRPAGRPAAEMEAATEPVGPAVCRDFTGTDGTRYPPLQPKGGALRTFVDMIGRSFLFRDRGSVDVSGIEGNRYTFDETTLAESAENRFCYQMRFKGLFNVSRPAYGPGVASRSYFLDTCYWDGDAAVKGDANDARRCVDKLWKGDDALLQVNDGFTGPRLTFNFSFAVPPVEDQRRARHLHGARPSPSERLTPTEFMDTISGGPGNYNGEYGNFVDVHQLTGVTLRGRADAMVATVLGPYGVDGCGYNATYTLVNFTQKDWPRYNVTVNYFNQSMDVPHTVLPFLRMIREASITGHWLTKLKDAIRLISVVRGLLAAGVALGVVGVIAAAVLRFVVVPRIAVGDPTYYDTDAQLSSLNNSPQKGTQQHLLQDG